VKPPKIKSYPKSDCRVLQGWVALDDTASTKRITGVSFMKIFRWLAFSALLAISASGAVAQDFDKGVAAYLANDYQTAFKEFLPLAEGGDESAQYNIGLMYDNGEGVIQNDAEALKWYRLAADQGNAGAQINLGVMYDQGEGATQNHVEAVKWYRLAADQGNSEAQYNLGNIYRTGDGVIQNDVEAVKWYRLASDQGNAGAQNNLGGMYETGKGAIQSNVLAHMWYNIASANGEENSAKRRDDIAAKMTREAIEKAQAMAQECISSGYKNCGE
jgi:TPR repeat protein